MLEDYQNVRARHLWLGQTGEELAGNYLSAHGFRLLERNWRAKPHYEVDIIAWKDSVLHCVEVKTKQDGSTFATQAAVDARKIAHLSRAMSIYRRMRRMDFPFVIDAVVVTFRSEEDYDLEFIPEVSAQGADDAFRQWNQ